MSGTSSTLATLFEQAAALAPAGMLGRYLAAMVALHRNAHSNGLPAGVNYYGAEEFVLVNGQEYVSEPLTSVEHAVVRDAARASRVRDFRQKQCYYNGMLLAINDATESLVYHEGYAHGETIPVHHGWCTINHKVVDLTWRVAVVPRVKWGDRVLGALPPGWEYRGVPFDTTVVRERICRTGMAVSMLDDWITGDPSPLTWPRPL